MDATFFGDAGYYDRWAKAYDAMVGSALYNKIFWGTNPRQYAQFAARAIGSGRGPLLEVAVGSAQATALLHVASMRQTTLVDRSEAMLELAGQSIARASGGTLPVRISLECRDMLAPTGNNRYETILGLGLLHLVPEVTAVVAALGKQLAPNGTMYLGSLAKGSRRSNAYLGLLKNHGDIAAARTATELFDQARSAELGPVRLTRRGAMAYLEIGG